MLDQWNHLKLFLWCCDMHDLCRELFSHQMFKTISQFDSVCVAGSEDKERGENQSKSVVHDSRGFFQPQPFPGVDPTFLSITWQFSINLDNQMFWSCFVQGQKTKRLEIGSPAASLSEEDSSSHILSQVLDQLLYYMTILLWIHGGEQLIIRNYYYFKKSTVTWPRYYTGTGDGMSDLSGSPCPYSQGSSKLKKKLNEIPVPWKGFVVGTSAPAAWPPTSVGKSTGVKQGFHLQLFKETSYSYGKSLLLDFVL